jgi:uncharacterized RDD family membrane protein YckC
MRVMSLNSEQVGQTSSDSPIVANRAKRFLSMMYEGALLFGVVFTADFLFDTLTQSRHGLMFRPARQLWLFVVVGVYFLLCWRRGGQTLPMRAWHIKVTDAHGLRPTFRQLVVRYIMLWPVPLAGMALIYGLVLVTNWPGIYTFAIVTPFLVFVPTWFIPGGHFLHDRLAGTQIIDIRSQVEHAASQHKSK